VPAVVSGSTPGLQAQPACAQRRRRTTSRAAARSAPCPNAAAAAAALRPWHTSARTQG